MALPSDAEPAQEFLAHANGATFLRVEPRRFKALPVRLAADSTRERLLRAGFGPSRQGATVMRENAALAQTRDTLLPLLMSGRVRVKDAEKTVEGVV